MRFTLPQLPVFGRLARKYVALLLSVVSLALVVHGATELYFFLRDYKTMISALQRALAETAATRIGEFVQSIERQAGWTTQLPWAASPLEDWRFDAARLFRQSPAITEFIKLDAKGLEQLRVSQTATDIVGSRTDFSKDPRVAGAMAHGVYFGPVFFRRGSEPYMTMALAGSNRNAGVTIVEINLNLIRDVISQVKVGATGRAYVIDGTGQLIAHPDISLVLRKLDFSILAHVRDTLGTGRAPADVQRTSADFSGAKVLAMSAPVAPLGWHVIVEWPVAEAHAPLNAAITRFIWLLLAALLLAALTGLLLTGRMLAPIQALGAGASRIGDGDFGHRIKIESKDELQVLGEQFNSMATRLEESYATLEGKVVERTQQLEQANLAKSRFIAAASHDLRQPLHAMGLFVTELRGHVPAGDAARVVARIDSAVQDMSEMFTALLDTSKLDAGVVETNVTAFPIGQLLQRIEGVFGGPAREKGLSLKVVPSTAWVRSDAVLLERVLLNLVSNAVRYTRQGGIVVGCRRRGQELCFEVRDTGPGIPEDQHKAIFTEFQQLPGRGRERHAGLGLGLSIVDRLCAILGHRIELRSKVGTGSRFGIVMPVADTSAKAALPSELPVASDGANGQLVIAIDDELLALEGIAGVLRSWGFDVVAARDADEALAAIDHPDRCPALVVSDYQLLDGKTGIEAIQLLRRQLGSQIPALLVSGDTSPDRLQLAREDGFTLLHKPVSPMRLRATINRLLKDHAPAQPDPPTGKGSI